MNPYEVLGVSETADEDTIKRAYRDLVKKYHPDKYVNNPLADLASEKLKEINQAYDMLMNKKEANSSNSGSYYQSGGQSSNTWDGMDSYRAVRMFISQGRFAEAEQMLYRLPQNAEWHYLMGVICQRKGWADRAASEFEQATSADPNNMEYRAAYNGMHNRGNAYRNYGPQPAGCGCSSCDCCTQLICADCCCECMGGDLISCC